MENKRASSETLDDLHGTVAQNYLDEIRKYKDGTYADEEGRPKPIPANLLAQAAKFLKDNGIDRPVQEGDPLDVLKDELPDFSNTNFG
jgi:hypothetical protein